VSEAEQEMWEAIAQQPPPEERKIKVGDVVYLEGSSALLGDVITLDTEDEDGTRYFEVKWRECFSTEDEDDLILKANA